MIVPDTAGRGGKREKGAAHAWCECVCVWMGKDVQQKPSSTKKRLKKHRKVVLQRGVHEYVQDVSARYVCTFLCIDAEYRFSSPSCDDVTSMVSLPGRYQKDGYY